MEPRKACRDGRKWSGCGIEKPLDAFPAAKQTKDGRLGFCRECLRKRDSLRRKADRKGENARQARKRARNRAAFAARKSRQEAKRRSALPTWFTRDLGRWCQEIYKERDRLTVTTGMPHHVDHVIPIAGCEERDGHLVQVCGLHVPWNLMPIPGDENEAKSNKFLEVAQALFEAEREPS